jgi:hypothetical protein
VPKQLAPAPALFRARIVPSNVPVPLSMLMPPPLALPIFAEKDAALRTTVELRRSVLLSAKIPAPPVLASPTVGDEVARTVFAATVEFVMALSGPLPSRSPPAAASAELAPWAVASIVFRLTVDAVMVTRPLEWIPPPMPRAAPESDAAAM